MRIYLLLSLLFVSLAHGEEKAADTIAVSGLVKIISIDNQERLLKRGSPVYAHEKIIVLPDSKAELKFTDGGLINLISSTEFIIDTYSYNNPDQKDALIGNLVKGGLRALSGSISKTNPDNTQIKTAVATIGLRGTTYQVTLSKGQAFCSCEQGQIEITNDQGRLLIGQGTAHQFASIRYKEQPQPLTSRPSQLNPQHFTPPPGGTPIGTPAPSSSNKVGGGPPQQGRIEINDLGGGCS